MRREALLLVAALLAAGCAAPAATPPAGDGTPGAALAIACPAPCEVAVDDGPLRAFEPTVAASPDGRTLVVASEEWAGAARWVHVHASTDGGATWLKTRLPGGPSAGPVHPLAACAMTFDPIVAVLEDGTILAGGVGMTPAPDFAYRALFIARSADGGRTFPETVVVPPGGGPACTAAYGDDPTGHFVDKPFLAAGAGGEVAVSWAASGSEPAFARSGDGGRTWTLLPPIDDAGAPDSKYSAALAFGRDGALHAAYGTWGENQFLDGVYHSVLRNGSWTTRLAAEGANAYPDVSVGPGPSGERVFVAYPLGENGGGATAGAEQTPMLTFSDDGGATWSAPVALDEPESGGWIVPTLHVDGRGVAWSGFFHHLPDDTNEYRVAAYDGTTVFGPLRVDRSPIGHQDLSLSLGHYMGLAGLPEGGFAVWVSGEAPATDLRGAAVRLVPAGIDATSRASP